MIFAWIVDLCVVIARENGRSSNHKILRDCWIPRFRRAWHGRSERLYLNGLSPRSSLSKSWHTLTPAASLFA